MAHVRLYYIQPSLVDRLVYIVPRVRIFPTAEVSTHYRGAILQIFHKEGLNIYFSLFHNCASLLEHCSACLDSQIVADLFK